MTAAPATRGSGGRREQQRAATLREIRAAARAQLADEGAAGLTLSAVARRAGLSQPGIYRYHANRDALLTDLVADGYASLATAVEAAIDPAAVPAAQVRAVGIAYRAWAVEDPIGFALIFGGPIPGYHAPANGPTVASAARISSVIIDVLLRVHERGELRPLSVLSAPPVATRPGPPLGGRLNELPSVVRDRFLDAWSRLHGMVCLEVFGHLSTYISDAPTAYTRLLDAMLIDLGMSGEEGGSEGGFNDGVLPGGVKP